ncbi:hypothetical protein CsSME_00002989 [Camellia sinensis var. sinensis]
MFVAEGWGSEHEFLSPYRNCASASESDREIAGEWGGYLFRPTEGVWRPTLDGVPFDVIPEVDCPLLKRAFTEEEVFETLQSMPGDKAPRPDGLSIAFSNTVREW